MWVSYSFEEVITALIHFTLYGWEKEEILLFNFVADHLGENILKANDWRRHTWFLLELYLQNKNKTIAGTKHNVYQAVKLKLNEEGQRSDLIPENLGVYEEVLRHWETSDLEEIELLISKMVEHHSILASELGDSDEFGDYRYAFYPYEILYLLHVREAKGLPVPHHFNDLLMNNPEAKMKVRNPEPYPEWDPLLRLIDNFYRKNYPEYIPNQYGKLFE